MRQVAALLLLASAIWAQQPPREEPVGVILVPSGAKLVRTSAETPLNARSGDLIFAGDTLSVQTGAVTFLDCSASLSQTLQAPGEVTFQGKQAKLKSGKYSASVKVSSCRLPPVVRLSAASQQHYGVTMVRSLGQPASALAPPDSFPAAVKAELSEIGAATDGQSLVARAAVFEKAGLSANALSEYQQASAKWPEAVWLKGKIFEVQESLADQAAKAAVSATAGGQTYAVVVGISKYQKLPQDLWLQYANADATMLHSHLLSPRGGAVPPQNAYLLTDEKATTAGIRTVLQMIEKGQAGKKDTVLLFFAGHGTVEIPGSKAAYIVTNDADPQDLASTALPMAEIQELIQKLTRVGRVIALVDVCRSGNIGSIKNSTVNAVVERLGESDGEIFGLMASRPKEVSYEGPQFGGGHGAFSYYLMKALGGDADKNKDGVVNVTELIDYVRQHVAEGTGDKQHPRDFGNIENTVPLSDLRKPGITVAHHFRVIERGNEPAYFASAGGQALPTPSPDLKPFSDALASGRLVDDGPDSAFQILRGLERSLTPEQYTVQENRLRAALEDRAQQVLLKYLAGDEVPQKIEDFRAGSGLMTAAMKLTPESLYLDARKAFFEGRTLLFDKQYAAAEPLLERSFRLDPAGAYAYNALGIASLEQGQFARAAGAFRDASRRAPHWAYPLHNLALTQFESGDSDEAVKTYNRAIRLRPDVSYLPYNLGLVYQKLNLRREAEDAYRQSAALAPNSAEPWNALGALKMSVEKYREAETLFRRALSIDPKLLAARHNLALVVARDPKRRDEAVALWRENLAASPDHLPSLLALAETLDRAGDTTAAIAAYRRAIALKDGYAGAHVALSQLLERAGDRQAARAEAEAAAKFAPDDAGIQERLGDLYTASGDTARATQSYNKAVSNAAKADRRRISRKLTRPESARR